jgi:hypothetical protein
MISYKAVASKTAVANFSDNNAPDSFTFVNDDRNQFIQQV